MPQPLIVAYGAGRDSTAMLIEMWKRKWRPDAILFANVGSEKRATYEFIPVFNRWLIERDFPPITVVQYQPVRAPYRTLEGNMIMNATLPGAAFNQHTCALKMKIQPQNKWTRKWLKARVAWGLGMKVVKLIGFECSEVYRLKRADARAHQGKGSKDAQKYEYRMPLMDWGYDLNKCMEIIDDEGLPMPPKSACYFCPFQKTYEVDDATPEDRARTILMELVAEPYNNKNRGLWRKTRKSDGRPGSVTEYILQKNLPFTPLPELCERVVLNPKCQKARTGHTFKPPHVGPTLRELLAAVGHEVPEVVLEAGSAGFRDGDYLESVREVASIEIETEQHLELVEAL